MHQQDLAERAAEAMLRHDPASAWFGITLRSVAPGRACMRLTIQPEHLNGHGTCHGGVIFALADTAFAVACNSDNRRAVAQHNQISYLSPGQLGETLTAQATVISQAGRTGITDVTVTADEGRVIAQFRGASRQIAGTHVDEETP